MEIKSFRHDDWTKIWDGGWSFLSCTHFGDEYTKEILFGHRPFKSQSIMFSARGRSSGWMRQSDRDTLGTFLASGVKARADAERIAGHLKQQSKDFLKFITRHEHAVATHALYTEFWARLCVYYKAHIHVKYVVDYLKPGLLKKYLPVFQSARLAAEPVLNRTEDFMRSFARQLGRRTGYSYRLLLCLTKFEVETYLRTGRLPKKPELAKRDKRAALLHNNKSAVFFAGKDVDKIEALVHQASRVSSVKGIVAFVGKVRGVVRLVPDPHKVKVFNQGDILVTGATRPEFLPIMHKAAAFVTDAGGILSHAAITAREMKKPCVISTQVATKVFKDGDVVEVDANRGIVKKLSH